MTWEERKYCREAVTAELRSTGADGIEELITSLDSSGFFTAGCKGHDEAEGGAVSHALWTLRFAREIARRKADEAETTDGEADGSAAPTMVPDVELIMATLGRSTSDGRPVPVSAACQELISEASEMAVEFADCIPFGTEPIDIADPDELDEWIDCVLDNDDHRLWTGGDDEFYDSIENSSTFPCHLVKTLTVRGEDDECDVAILSDDIGNYTLMLLSSEEGEDALFRSDRRVFVYTDMIFYITRFPKYRSSYVALCNAKGRWGLVALRDDRKRRSGHLIADEKVVDFSLRSPGKAVHALQGKDGRKIGITDKYFYRKVKI